jgi:hypothetical protein
VAPEEAKTATLENEKADAATTKDEKAASEEGDTQ